MTRDSVVADYMAEIGRKGGAVGGKAKVKKGIAMLSPAKQKRIRAKALATRRANAALKEKKPE